MNAEKHLLVLVLIIINQGGHFSKSYGLIKILAWKFRVIDVTALTREIEREQYVEFELINGVHHYTLTLLGRDFIAEHYSTAKELLFAEYPDEAEILENFFASVSS